MGKTVGPGPFWSLPRHIDATPLDDRAFCLRVFEVDCPRCDNSTIWTGDWHGHLIVQRSRVRSLRKVGVLISEGAPPKGIYAALEGRVRAMRCAGDADEILVYVGEAGFWVGEFAVLARVPSISSVVAHSAVRTPFLPAAEFERIVGDEPRYFRAFADLSFERHALLFRHLVEARGLAPKERLRTRLVDLAAMRRDESPTSDAATIAMSQSDLAKIVGVFRQVLSRMLDRLDTRGLIKIGYRSIRVLG